MQVYELKISDVNEVMHIVNNIISKPHIIKSLRLRFSNDINNIIGYIIERYGQCLAFTEDNVWIYYDGNSFYFCKSKTIKQVIKKLMDNYSNNVSQDVSYEINNKLIAIDRKLENIQEKQVTFNYNGLLSNILKPSNQELKSISKKIDVLNNMINFQFNENNSNDITKDLCDIVEKVDGLNKQMSFIEDDLKAQKDLLRSIRNQGEDDIDSSKQITRSINNILGTVTLLKNDIENIKFSSENDEKDSEEEIEIINPDVELLNEMHETASKLNDLILKTALMVANKGDVTKNKSEDIKNNHDDLDNISDENDDIKNNQEIINDDIEESNDQIIIEELKD